MENFKPKTYNYFIHKGLNKKSNPNNTISIIIRNKNGQELLKFYSFNNSSDALENNIPFYHKEVPDGYSLFCSQLEYVQLMNFLKKNKGGKKKKKEEEDILESEPGPNKRNYICQICKSKFDNYIEHINSKLHYENKLKYRNLFIRMKLTFRRISNYNEEMKNKKNINELEKDNSKIDLMDLKNSEEEKGKNSSIINLDNTNNITTRYDSFIINDENKDINKQNFKAGLVNTKKGKEKLNEILEENISVKDILNILDSIDEQSKINSLNIKKRKKNEKNKYFFNENYLYDLKRITGKISYLESINKMNK